MESISGLRMESRESDFYTITERGDGLVDVYLRVPDGIRVVSGLENYPALEDDVRMRFDDWCASGETIEVS
ncbi:MAG: hypothetical protein JW811_00750 [Clostridiales bacterium]|nr:hypothetical protein [Clostridiales bacterium]